MRRNISAVFGIKLAVDSLPINAIGRGLFCLFAGASGRLSLSHYCLTRFIAPVWKVLDCFAENPPNIRII